MSDLGKKEKERRILKTDKFQASLCGRQYKKKEKKKM